MITKNGRFLPTPFCNDCGVHVLGHEYFMVHNELWQSINRPRARFLCVGCLEERLGRQLTRQDFTDCPLNRDLKRKMSARLRSRLTGEP